MKFIIHVAVFAVAAANNVYDKAPVYSAPTYKSPYSAPTLHRHTPHRLTPHRRDIYSYNVKDEPSYNDFIHSESTDGKVTTGSYKVALPNGRIQIVSYKADSYGYTTDVKYEGEAKYPDYKKAEYKASSYSTPAPANKAPTTTYKTPAYSVPDYPKYKAPLNHLFSI